MKTVEYFKSTFSMVMLKAALFYLTLTVILGPYVIDVVPISYLLIYVLILVIGVNIRKDVYSLLAVLLIFWFGLFLFRSVYIASSVFYFLAWSGVLLLPLVFEKVVHDEKSEALFRRFMFFLAIMSIVYSFSLVLINTVELETNAKLWNKLFLVNRNSLSSYLVCLLPFTLSHNSSLFSRSNLVFSFALVMASYVAWLASCKIALLGIIVTVLLVLLFKKRNLFKIAILTSVLACLYFVYSYDFQRIELLYYDRLGMAMNSLNMIGSNYFTGVGLGNWSYFDSLNFETWNSTYCCYRPKEHNLFLLLFAELGFIGFFLLGSLIVFVFSIKFKFADRSFYHASMISLSMVFLMAMVQKAIQFEMNYFPRHLLLLFLSISWVRYKSLNV